MKKIIEWLSASNRWKHLVGGLLIGLGSDNWYCALYAGTGVAAALGRKQMTIKVASDSTDTVQLAPGTWNYGAIVSALVRHKYSESEVEAILSNSLLLLGGASTVSEDEAAEKQTELNEFQTYRETCKVRAKELLALGAEMGLTEM